MPKVAEAYKRVETLATGTTTETTAHVVAEDVPDARDDLDRIARESGLTDDPKLKN
jgi:hypothetical protein